MYGKAKTKEVWRRFLLLIGGAVAGFFLIPIFTVTQGNRETFSRITGFFHITGSLPGPIPYPIKGYYVVAVYVILTMVALLAVEGIIYLFGNSKRKTVMEIVMDLVCALVAGIPLTLLLFVKFDAIRPVGNEDFENRLFVVIVLVGAVMLQYDFFKKNTKWTVALVYIMLVAWPYLLMQWNFMNVPWEELKNNTLLYNNVWIFGVVFAIIQRALEGSLLEKMKKPYKRHKLSVYRVKNTRECVETDVIASGLEFEKCFSAMQLNKDRVGGGEFFKITELAFDKKRVVTSWNYDGDGRILEMSDEELCRFYGENVLAFGQVLPAEGTEKP